MKRRIEGLPVALHLPSTSPMRLAFRVGYRAFWTATGPPPRAKWLERLADRAALTGMGLEADRAA